MKNKGTITFVVFCMFFSMFFTACKPLKPTSSKINEIPAWGNKIYFDWSLLPKGEKGSFYSWSEPFIYKMLSLKICTEKEAEVPSREIKRGEFLQWLLKAKNVKLVSRGHEFKDVPKEHPYRSAILTAVELGIIDKTQEFRPDDPLIRSEASIWLINAKGEEAKKTASTFKEPLIPAQDGFYEVPKEAVGALSTCILPENQLIYYRWKEGEDFRLIKPNAPMIVAEALHSIFMLAYPPKRGGTVTVGMSMEPKTLFAGLEQTAAFSQISPLLYYDTIGGRDENWSLFPVMIKRIPTRDNGLWKVLDDGRMEVTFELHKGLKWADGQEITADDALFAYLFTTHPSFPTIHNESDFWLDKVVVKDTYTAVAYWNQHYTFANLSLGLFPRHYFEKELNYHLDAFNMNDKKYYDPSKDDPKTTDKDESFKSEKFLADEQFINKATQSDTETYNYIKNPMHAGPYKVKKWELGQSIILEPNENFMFGKPLLDSFVFRTIENTDTLLAATMAGNVDMTLTGLTFDQAMQLKKKTNIPQVAFFTPSLMWAHLDLNIDDPILSDLRVRKALLHGIDRQGISTQMFEGIQPVADSWLPPKHPAYNDKTISKYTFDPKKAGELLDSAGWKLNPTTKLREKNGQPFTISFITAAGNKLGEQIEAVVSSDWKSIGLQVTQKNEQATSLFGTTLKERKFKGPTAVMYSWVMGPDSNMYSICNSKQIPTQANGWSGQNYTAFKNEIVDRLTDDNMKQLDKKKIYENLWTIQEIMTKELPSLPLYYRVDVTSANPNIRGYAPTGSGVGATWNGPWWSWDR